MTRRQMIASSEIVATDARETIVCPHCKLTQFVTVRGSCRRCKRPLGTTCRRPAGDLSTVRPSREPRELTIATCVKTVRLARGMSQRALCDRLKSPRSWVSKIENGKSSPSLKSLDRIASALKVTLSELIEGDAKAFVVSGEFMRELAELLPHISDADRIVFLHQVRRRFTVRHEN